MDEKWQKQVKQKKSKNENDFQMFSQAVAQVFLKCSKTFRRILRKTAAMESILRKIGRQLGKSTF